MLEQAFTEVYTGQLEPKRATAMAALARSMVAVLTSGDLEERLRNLEVKVKESEVTPQEFAYQHEGKDE
jgi:hypothetical protein